MARILVADDEPDLRDALRRVCEKDGHQVFMAADGRETVEQVRAARPDLLVLDNRMPRLSGLDALAEIREFNADLVTVLFTAHDDAADVQRAVLELRAFGYLTKDSGVEAIRATIHSALRSRGLLAQETTVQNLVPDEVGFGQMIGQSAPMLAIYDLIKRISHSDVTVLLQGESGTGKELVARALHDTSRRGDGAYITVDCGSLPDTLTESEIFGFEAGAFTDAKRAKPGKLELADGGTFFLDEIGNLSHTAQAKLLRVLEDRKVSRLGGQTVKDVDVRIIAATNLDLEVASLGKAFREDLYYRLNVFKIDLPPLRDRAGDVPLLVDHYISRFAIEQRKTVSGATPEAIDVLSGYRWPGNVRELRNVLERAVLLCGEIVEAKHLPADMGGDGVRAFQRAAASGGTGSAGAQAGAPAAVPEAGPSGVGDASGFTFPAVDLDGTPLKEAKRLAGEQVEKAYLLAALRKANWNKSEAARLLQLNYKTLREKVRAHDLERLRYE